MTGVTHQDRAHLGLDGVVVEVWQLEAALVASVWVTNMVQEAERHCIRLGKVISIQSKSKNRVEL